MAQLFPWNNIGFEVVQSFFSAKDALNYLREHPVDVVLSDIQMPDMTGLELCRELLDNPDHRSYDVAYDVGYDSPNNFSRAFKAFMGCTPSEYRHRREENDG